MAQHKNPNTMVPLLLFLSLSSTALSQHPSGHRPHHLPDTAPEMDLRPAFQRSTARPHHHSHDFSLPMPSRGWSWDTTPDYDGLATPTDYDDYGDYETVTVRAMETSASGDDYDYEGTTAEIDDGRVSLNDQLASDASQNKLKSTLLLVLALALLLIT